ncbi:hypothetical protein [Roseateles sp.]|uniref:hypothetical protein n=1 Tax=Roseateles sp. TaxID=1971397 RepID=UPI003263C431
MSERQIHDPQSTPQAPAPVDASAGELASVRRRRFIKAGAGVIPVALTLSSRPVLATTQGKCFSASAWGSIQTLVGTNASQYTRKASKAPTVNCYTKAEWCATSNGNPTCAGWKVSSISCANLQLNTVKAYNVTKACGTSSGTAGVGGNTSVWTALTGNSCSDAQKAVLVAWLNFRISTTTSTDVCVIDSFSSNQLTTLGNIVRTGGGTGPDGKQWSPTNVKDYLHNNYIGRLS